MNRQDNKSALGVVLKTLYPANKTHTISKSRLERPPLPLVGSAGPALTSHSPNTSFIKLSTRKQSFSIEPRFNALKDLNKIKNEQVSPQSYNIMETKYIHRPVDKQNYSGKMARDRSERLSSSPLFQPNRDRATNPAPTETDKDYQTGHRFKVTAILKEQSKDNLLQGAEDSDLYQTSVRNLPTISKKLIKTRSNTFYDALETQ